MKTSLQSVFAPKGLCSPLEAVGQSWDRFFKIWSVVVFQLSDSGHWLAECGLQCADLVDLTLSLKWNSLQVWRVLERASADAYVDAGLNDFSQIKPQRTGGVFFGFLAVYGECFAPLSTYFGLWPNLRPTSSNSVQCTIIMEIISIPQLTSCKRSRPFSEMRHSLWSAQ